MGEYEAMHLPLFLQLSVSVNTCHFIPVPDPVGPIALSINHSQTTTNNAFCGPVTQFTLSKHDALLQP